MKKGAVRDEKAPEVAPGEFVGVKLWARDEVNMKPNDLIRIGWPNRFMVVDVVDVEGEPHLSLDPCCNWMRNAASGKFHCDAHPARYFEKIDEDVPNKGDRYFSIHTPFGEITSVDFMDNGPKSTAVVNILGKQVVLHGEVWRRLAEKAVERGIL